MELDLWAVRILQLLPSYLYDTDTNVEYMN